MILSVRSPLFAHLLNPSFTLEIKVCSRAMSNWVIWKSNEQLSNLKEQYAQPWWFLRIAILWNLYCSYILDNLARKRNLLFFSTKALMNKHTPMKRVENPFMWIGNIRETIEIWVGNLRTHKGSLTRDNVTRFFSVFFHQIAHPGLIRGTLGPFQFCHIFLQILEYEITCAL